MVTFQSEKYNKSSSSLTNAQDVIIFHGRVASPMRRVRSNWGISWVIPPSVCLASCGGDLTLTRRLHAGRNTYYQILSNNHYHVYLFIHKSSLISRNKQLHVSRLYTVKREMLAPIIVGVFKNITIWQRFYLEILSEESGYSRGPYFLIWWLQILVKFINSPNKSAQIILSF